MFHIINVFLLLYSKLPSPQFRVHQVAVCDSLRELCLPKSNIQFLVQILRNKVPTVIKYSIDNQIFIHSIRRIRIFFLFLSPL